MKRSLSTVAAVALMATTASAETRYATITHIQPNYQEVTSNQPVNICSDVEVPIYGNVQGGGASGGDVLTGMILSFLSQGYTSLESTLMACYEHGKAGDLAKNQLGENQMIARDIIDKIRF